VKCLAIEVIKTSVHLAGLVMESFARGCLIEKSSSFLWTIPIIRLNGETRQDIPF